MKDYDNHTTLAVLFGLQPTNYIDSEITSVPFSFRLQNRLRQNGIFTVKDLLLVDIAFLNGISGFGADCLSQVLSFCENIGSCSNRISPSRFRVFIARHKDAISHGDFSFLSNTDLTDEQLQLVSCYQEAFGILGEKLAQECVSAPEHILPIIETLSSFTQRYEIIDRLTKLTQQIPSERRNKSSKLFIDAYTNDNNLRAQISECYLNENDPLVSIINSIDTNNELLLYHVEHFLKWCSFDLARDVSDLFEKVYKTSRIQTVIEGRANHLTLNELGDQLGITRERVRQIEMKARRSFAKQLSIKKIIQKIIADQNGRTIIPLEDIISFSGEYSTAFIYFLKDLESSALSYDSLLDAFIIGDNDLSTRIQDYIDSLPDMIRKSDLEQIISTAQTEFDLNPEYTEKAFYEAYKTTGDVFHRTRLSLAKIYESTIKKHFKNGIHVYDDKEIEELRRLIVEEYGEIRLPSVNRAIAARISNVCVLVGRGTYIAKRDRWISKELSQRIFSFIMNNNSPILLIRTVFDAFEQELIAEGIDNRYFLQGVLRELFGDKLYFRRDYVSKDKTITSIYSSIVSFIKRFQYPVTKEELKAEFQGITDVVIAFATSDSDILNYYGSYLHGCRLVVHDTERAFLSQTMQSIVQDHKAHHIQEFYSIIRENRPELFSRNAITATYAAFSVLEYLFREQYQFSRPFIALNDVEIGRPSERLLAILYGLDEFSISDITGFAKENHWQIQSLIDFINSMNDKYLLRDSNTVSVIDSIGVTEDIAKEVELVIIKEISEAMPIRSLTCIDQLPKIPTPWNEWLLYSVIKKWGQRLDVALSSPQFRQSIPLISRRGEMRIVTSGEYDTNPEETIIYDMDDIDDLVADILSEEMLEEIK